MFLQLFSSNILHPIFHLTISLILLKLPEFHAQEIQQFSECLNQTFNCGKNIREIVYPFWGGNRPSYCGREGFELSCKNDDVATINIESLTFRILSINQSGHEIKIARTVDIQDDRNICPPVVTSTLSNRTLVGYSSGTEIIYLYYDCPSELNIELPNISIWGNFTCTKNGAQNYGFYAGELLSSDELRKCKTETVAAVLRGAFKEFREDASMTMAELLKEGFLVDYIIDEIAFSACVNSGGLCGSYVENSRRFQCICRDGVHRFTCPKTGRKNRVALKIGIGLGSLAFGIACTAFAFFICNRRKKTKHGIGAPASAYCLNLATFGKTKSDKDVEAFIRQYGFSTPKRYKYSTLESITNSFKHELGKGGYGNVYKGKLPDGRVVAVKVLNVSKGKGEEFINEVASIGRTSHVNVVTLLGFCYEGKRRALIYEFMPNGSLEKFIYGKKIPMGGQHLGCEKLYNIALGIARGLEYLHQGCNTRIVHFDIKPHNILLDEDFCPKISDFGLAKLYTKKESIISMMEARGTIGYIAPEVFSRNFGQVSHKSDVYSYGMMILEMVGGRKNVDAGAIHTSEIYFPHWIYNHIELNEELNLVSAMTIEENEIARKMIIVGLWCIQTDPSQRPSISKVIEMLEGSITALEIPPKPYLCSPRQGSNS